VESIVLNYLEHREILRWNTEGDHLYRDGMDHYQMDAKRFDRAVKVLSPLEDCTICELGAFPGFGLWAFRDCKRYIALGKGPDWFKEALSSRFNIELMECDFEDSKSLPKLEYKPDIVTLCEVLEHIRRPKAFLKAVYEWMPSGARLYLTTNNIHYIGYILKLCAGKEIFHPAETEDSIYPGHCTYYSKEGLTRFLEDVGFKVLSASRLNFLPPSQFYRRRLFGGAKNMLTRIAGSKYATHLEVLCQKQ